MSLNFNFDEMIQKKGQAHFDKFTTSVNKTPEGKAKWHEVTDSLVWLSLTIGLNHLHKDNIEEWSERIAAVQGIYGADFAFDDETKIYITREDLENHVGMRTNAGRMTKTAFYARLMKMARDRGMQARKAQPLAAFDLINTKLKLATGKEAAATD